jgi:hypothetical protein
MMIYWLVALLRKTIVYHVVIATPDLRWIM